MTEMTIKEAINWYETKLTVNEMMNLKGLQNDAARLALDALRAQQEQSNEPLTLDELRELVGGMSWCDDTDGIAPGLVCLREGWDDYKKELHIWLLDNEGNIGVYDMHTMMECGAKFYRRKPEEGD